MFNTRHTHYTVGGKNVWKKADFFLTKLLALQYQQLNLREDTLREAPKPFYLADWHVDPGTDELCRDGVAVKLESKVMAVLLYLTQHRNEVVTREMLEQAVWGNTVVGYDALTGCIAKLRKALEDDPRQPRYIETIPKKGYRLIGEIAGVTPQTHSPAPVVGSGPAKTSNWRWLSLGILAMGIILGAVMLTSGGREDQPRTTTAASLPSIAVLPFANLSGESGQDYFSDGITADITTALSKLSGLFVISPASASGYRETPVDLQHIAGTLGVRYVVEGQVRRTGERLRVNVHLVDAGSDIVLWSEKYDRELRNVFSVQDDITANIVNTLSIKLTEAERQRTARQYTTSIAAYDDFLRGQAAYNHYTEKDNQQARDYFQQAMARDESFARAYSSMALTYVAEYRYGWEKTSPDPLRQALQLAQQSISLDSDSPQANWVLAYVHLFRQEYKEAAAVASRVIELDPNYANSYITLAVCKMRFGEAEAALHLVKKAMLLNPIYPASYVSMLGQIYYFLGEYEQAVPALREATERNMNLPTPHVFLIATLSRLGKMEEARWAAEQLKSLAPDFSAESIDGMIPLQDPKFIAEMKTNLQRVGL